MNTNYFDTRTPAEREAEPKPTVTTASSTCQDCTNSTSGYCKMQQFNREDHTKLCLRCKVPYNLHVCYSAPCAGCSGGHPSFHKTIIESKEWQAWTEHNSKEPQWDLDESRELGIISTNHWEAFLIFLKCCHKPFTGEECTANPDPIEAFAEEYKIPYEEAESFAFIIEHLERKRIKTIVEGMKTDERKVAVFGKGMDSWEAITYDDKMLVNAVLGNVAKAIRKEPT